MKNILLLVFITLAACFTPIFAKITVPEISPVSLGFLRFSVAGILFYLTLLLRKDNLRFEKKDLPMVILLGVLCIPVNQYFFLTGISLSFASHSGVIYSLNPVFAYLLGVAGNTERFYLSKLFAILLTVTGIFFVFYENLSSGSIASPVIIGDIYLILAVLSFSLYLSLGKKVIDRYGALKVTTFAFISGSIAYLPFFLLDLQNLKLENVSFQGLAGLVYLTIIVSYLAYFTWYYSMKSIALSKIATMSNLSPLLTVLFSIIFLSEKISIFFIIGGIITLTGVILMHRISLELN